MDDPLEVTSKARSYHAHVGTGLLARTGQLVRELPFGKSATRCAVVTDDRVGSFYAPRGVGKSARGGLLTRARDDPRRRGVQIHVRNRARRRRIDRGRPGPARLHRRAGRGGSLAIWPGSSRRSFSVGFRSSRFRPPSCPRSIAPSAEKPA